MSDQRQARYWHPTCVLCRQPKTAADSHCESRMCPWHGDCWRARQGREP